MEDVFDSPDYPRFQLMEEFQISPVLKNTLFRSETDDIPYEAWDSNDRCSPVHIEGLHRLRIISRTVWVSFDPSYVTLSMLILKFWRMKIRTLIFRQSLK